jgi:hypothetical protein
MATTAIFKTFADAAARVGSVRDEFHALALFLHAILLQKNFRLQDPEQGDMILR